MMLPSQTRLDGCRKGERQGGSIWSSGRAEVSAAEATAGSRVHFSLARLARFHDLVAVRVEDSVFVKPLSVATLFPISTRARAPRMANRYKLGKRLGTQITRFQMNEAADVCPAEPGSAVTTCKASSKPLVIEAHLISFAFFSFSNFSQ